jgi:very-short-patch-repair endonuclease
MRNNPTYGEAAAWKLFQRLNYQYPDFIWRRQIVVFGVIPDFYCEHLRVAVEIDGAVHQGREEEDKRKDLYLEKRGIRVLRVPNAMVIHSPRLFLEKIKEVSER